MKRSLAFAVTVIAAAVAMAIPSTAAAAVIDGSGGGGYRITTDHFIGYNCYYHSSYNSYYGTGRRYNCHGGVYVKYWGERRWGTKCVVGDPSGWGWFDHRC